MLNLKMKMYKQAEFDADVWKAKYEKAGSLEYFKKVTTDKNSSFLFHPELQTANEIFVMEPVERL